MANVIVVHGQPYELGPIDGATSDLLRDEIKNIKSNLDKLLGDGVSTLSLNEIGTITQGINAGFSSLMHPILAHKEQLEKFSTAMEYVTLKDMHALLNTVEEHLSDLSPRTKLKA